MRILVSLMVKYSLYRCVGLLSLAVVSYGKQASLRMRFRRDLRE